MYGPSDGYVYYLVADARNYQDASNWCIFTGEYLIYSCHQARRQSTNTLQQDCAGMPRCCLFLVHSLASHHTWLCQL
jgi:hypothetical protein